MGATRIVVAPTFLYCMMFECLVILDVTLGKHVIRQGFQFSERHVLHGMLYLANQLVSLEIIVIAFGRDVNLLLILVRNYLLYYYHTPHG